MFQQCQNKEEVEKLYKRLAKRLHPDCGGEHEFMILLNESSEIALNQIKGPTSPTRFYNPQDLKSPPPPKPDERVFINDTRLVFIKGIRQLLKQLPANSPVISIIKFLDDNQFLTVVQYLELKSFWEQATSS